MRSKLSQAPTPGGFGRPSHVLLIMLMSTTMALIGLPALASDVGKDPTEVQQQPPAQSHQPDDHQAKQNDAPQPSAPSATPSFCEALAAAAAANDLPVDFFTRLIWQESHFKVDAISPKGAQGVAQFMPATAKSSGLENPFNPLQAITKSGQLLRDLRREFGNLGLAAAAYNAGSARVHDWLGGRRSLPLETRAYVRFVTGRTAEEWAGDQADSLEMRSAEALPCNLPANASIQLNPDASPSGRDQAIKPWGVEVVGGPTRAKALERYREWQSKYATILADRVPRVVIRGIIGQMGAARVRVGEDTRVAAEKLCAALRAAGAYCDVWRN